MTVKAKIEGALRQWLGARAKEPDPDAMNSMERREAEAAMQRPGDGPREDGPRPTDRAHIDADQASQERMMPMQDDLADDTPRARQQGQAANETDGSHLSDDVVDDTRVALSDAEYASPHEPPRDELAADSEEARRNAERASQKGSG